MSEKKITETANTANLQLGDSNHEFPIFDGTIGPSVVDISKLYAQTGRFTYDPGFTSTASCESKITYIDGDEGILLYRGYPIGELAEKSSFLETSYLLLKGELPNKNDYNEFVTSIANEANVPSQLHNFFPGLARMHIRWLCFVALSADYQLIIMRLLISTMRRIDWKRVND